ncbi:hypothetical protein [Chamaesiphon sp. OTE_20_metabat_361]|uniref:hypothetical protein n=1 Tax=Chamaesiphon sp. OTE_20_metabat_361 TaxID=2964689 RepID=UPI00286BF5C2|nr:hypothetical protein [Chamaesiphon sp. OTE_20_metabat_361]
MFVSKQWWKLIGLVGIVATLSSCSRAPASSTPSTQAIANTTPAPLPAPQEVLMTDFQQIDGTPYLYAPIYVATQEQRSIIKEIKSAASESYEGRSEGVDIRNYMFVHRDNLSASKLLTNNSSRLLQMEQISATTTPVRPNPDSPPKGKGLKTVTALWHLQVLTDTNGDKIFSSSDRKQIAISDVSGASYTEIIKDIDRVLLVYPKGLDRRLVIYTSGAKRFIADVDITKRKATIKELPSIN